MSALPKAVSAKVYLRDGYKCRHCRERNALHPHHVIYKSRGGPDDLNNLLTLCWQCHEAEHKKLLEIIVLAKLENDLTVRFVRHKNWRPQ